jgi:hypothetical protein
MLVNELEGRHEVSISRAEGQRLQGSRVIERGSDEVDCELHIDTLLTSLRWWVAECSLVNRHSARLGRPRSDTSLHDRVRLTFLSGE